MFNLPFAWNYKKDLYIDYSQNLLDRLNNLPSRGEQIHMELRAGLSKGLAILTRTSKDLNICVQGVIFKKLWSSGPINCQALHRYCICKGFAVGK